MEIVFHLQKWKMIKKCIVGDAERRNASAIRIANLAMHLHVRIDWHSRRIHHIRMLHLHLPHLGRLSKPTARLKPNPFIGLHGLPAVLVWLNAVGVVH